MHPAPFVTTTTTLQPIRPEVHRPVEPEEWSAPHQAS